MNETDGVSGSDGLWLTPQTTKSKLVVLDSKAPQTEPQEPKVDDRLDGLDVARLNQLLFKLIRVKRRRDPSLPHHRLVVVKFLLLAYRDVQSDGEAAQLHLLLDQLAVEPGLSWS